MHLKALRQIRLRLGMVFQSFNLFPHFSVMRNITEAPIHVAKAKGSTRNSQRIAKKVGADVQMHILQLSGGESQRVAIARALAMNPEIFFR